MIVTEKNAKEKWCPFSFIQAASKMKCTASECMMWRWYDMEEDDEGKRKGYCGVAVEPTFG